jgi:hypothetical protein
VKKKKERMKELSEERRGCWAGNGKEEKEEIEEKNERRCGQGRQKKN